MLDRPILPDLGFLYQRYLEYMRDSAEGLVGESADPPTRRRLERLCQPVPRDEFVAMVTRMDEPTRQSFERGLALGYYAERESWGREVAERAVRRAIKRRGDSGPG